MKLRSVALAGLSLLLAACGPKPDVAPVDAKADVVAPSFDRALIYQTGDANLPPVTAVSWTGKAVVHFNGQSLELGVETRVAPYGDARSASWPAAQGRDAMRTLVIEGGKGFVEAGAKREPMPDSQTAHERQQFGLYGLMLLETLRASGGKVAFVDERCFTATHVEAPETAFCVDEAGALVRAKNDVFDPVSPGTRLHQEITFSGEVSDNGIRWPKAISIRQQGAPYFDLTIEAFKVERLER